jgi:hypothetical protein
MRLNWPPEDARNVTGGGSVAFSHPFPVLLGMPQRAKPHDLVENLSRPQYRLPGSRSFQSTRTLRGTSSIRLTSSPAFRTIRWFRLRARDSTSFPAGSRNHEPAPPTASASAPRLRRTFTLMPTSHEFRSSGGNTPAFLLPRKFVEPWLRPDRLGRAHRQVLRVCCSSCVMEHRDVFCPCMCGVGTF